MDGDTVVFNEEERAKDAFSPDGWAHALAWGSFYWPLESGYLPDTEPNRERALETVELASECQIPNLIKQKTAVKLRMLLWPEMCLHSISPICCRERSALRKAHKS